ncbi:MAG: hypothetical protein K6F07_04075, partial [Bacilli bacterium]|nr:hypothetical protein [Bacilli bacterium]
MSVDPSEINTMAPYINNSEGHLLVFGLGMGYFPYLASKNKKVKDITIVELDENIIDIFHTYLLPKLDFSCPIHIIHDDAFNYIKHHDMSKFDTLFMDIWHNPEDGLPLFIKFENLLIDYKGKKYYWLHKSLLAMLRRCLLTVLEEQISGATEKDYLKENNDYDHIINQLYFLTKEEIIDNPSKIKEILSDEYLSKLAKKVR